MKLDEVAPRTRLLGIVPGEPVTVVGLTWHTDEAIEVTYRTLNGALHVTMDSNMQKESM